MTRKPDLERRQERQDAFLAAFAKTGLATRAASEAGIPASYHYRWLREDSAYAERFAVLHAQTRDIAARSGGRPGPPLGSRVGGSRGAARLERQDRFLGAVARGLPLMAAGREMGMVAPTVHYQWLADDADYAKRFREVFERSAPLREAYISRTLSQAAAGAWSKPASHEARRATQRSRRLAESGALERTAQQGPFLAIISEGIPLERAVRDAGITKTIHRQWLQADPDYAEAFQRIYEDSAEQRKQVISAMRSRASAARWEKPGARDGYREWSRQYWTAERRQDWSGQMQAAYKDPARREKLLAAAREWWERPDSREINSQRMKRLWADPDYRERYQAAISNDERRAKLSEAAKAQWAALSEEEKQARLASMRRAFKGGYKLTAIESAVMMALNDREVPHLVHKQIGRYTADILIPSLHLVIECDGAWHHARRMASDQERDEELRALGFETLRLSEEEIKAKEWSRLDEVLARLMP